MTGILTSDCPQARISFDKEDLIRDGARDNCQTFISKPTLGELQFFLRAVSRKLPADEVSLVWTHYHLDCLLMAAHTVCRNITCFSFR